MTQDQSRPPAAPRAPLFRAVDELGLTKSLPCAAADFLPLAPGASATAGTLLLGLGPRPEILPVYGPNIRDWPDMPALSEHILLKVCSKIMDDVTTTDELIPSGETSSFRSNPLGLAEFTLSRRDPAYVGRSKEVRALEEAREAGKNPEETDPEIASVFEKIRRTESCSGIGPGNTEIGSMIYAVKPGDGSAREQAASCQKVLGGWANIANEYATKRYRSNLINWGMLPFVIPAGDLPFREMDYLFFPGIRSAVRDKAEQIPGYAVRDGKLVPFAVALGTLTDEEREIILDGCLINFNRPEK